ncbi:hypothetical protein ZIOFF_027135 [Zingiber officinale]|uniref:Uncharacterized protein n=1 Tax=Zingiber officinale TaxID=94328 RepID=A0A8J5LIF8_ZINOF|nr:hypothetical protein ZIOFF_027135 [Zingiber officinale]
MTRQSFSSCIAMEASNYPDPRTPRQGLADDGHFRVKRRALEAVLENCRMALELLENPDLDPGPSVLVDHGERSPRLWCLFFVQLCSLLKSKVESPNFLEKLGNIRSSVSQNIKETNSYVFLEADDNASWNIINAADSWEDKLIDGENGSDEDYVLVNQEDVVDSIANFMAAYLLSLEKTKVSTVIAVIDYQEASAELTPDQLQEVLCKAFSLKKRKSRLWKAWQGSQIIYNAASWSATAIGIYQNPAILEKASVAIWSSCNAISKLF